jgi:membrane fusion protein (multidrug efflux system)
LEPEIGMRIAIGLLITVICFLGFPACSSKSGGAQAQQAQQPIVAVGTAYAERKPIAKTFNIVGRVEAMQRVEVKARVVGYLDAVLFKEGDYVKEGTPLYRIEKGLFEANVKQAEAALERSKAAQVLTAIQLQRAQQLLATSSGTVVARDQAMAADQQAKAAILADEAALQTAKINLSYTDIVSPIGGKVGKTNITKGNVVGPDTGVLTVIVSQNPMYVTFPVSQREFLKTQEAGRKANVGAIKVRIRFANGTMYGPVGKINFVDVTVDRATDTVLVRATMPNPSGALIDGQLVQVVLEAGKPEEKVVVPQAALIADQGGVYVFVVENGKAVVRRIKIGGEAGSGVIVDQGLSGGEQVIVEGLSSVRPGAAVQAAPLPAALKGE